MIGTLIGGVLGLAGMGANKQNVDSTNKQNYEIARMNNQFNEKMFERQMHYNTEMWNAQNRYNDPAAQVERLKNAGLNPYMMLDGGSAGIAQGANGVNPPTAQAATMQPFQGHGQFAEMVMRGLDYDLAKAEKKEHIRTMQQQRQIDFMDAMNRLIHSRQDLFDKKTINALNKVTLKYAEDNQVADLRAKEDAHVISAKEIEIKTAEATQAKLIAANMPQTIANDLALQGADLALKVAQRDLTQEQAQNMFFDTWKKQLQGDKQSLDNKLMRETWNDLVLKAKIEASPNIYNIPSFLLGRSYGLTGKFRPKSFDFLGPVFNY